MLYYEPKEFFIVWFGLWCLILLSTIFQVYRGGQLRPMKDYEIYLKGYIL
jgi:hypothetical protein